MVVAVLVALRPVFKQPAVLLQIRDDRFAAVKLDRAFPENLDLPARLRAEAFSPVRHALRRRDAVDLLQDLPGLHAVPVLLDVRQIGENRLEILAVDPFVYAVRPLHAGSEMQRPAHRDAERRDALGHLEHFTAVRVFPGRRDAQQVRGAAAVLGPVLFVGRPALFYRLQPLIAVLFLKICRGFSLHFLPLPRRIQ